MSNEKKIGVALVKELCLICTKEIDGPIIMNNRLSKSEAKKVEEAHGKVIGFKKEPCNECKENLDKAFLFIGIDESKTNFEDLPHGFWRTGHIVGVKKEIPLVQEFVKEHSPEGFKEGFLFIPFEMMQKLGLIKTETN